MTCPQCKDHENAMKQREIKKNEQNKAMQTQLEAYQQEIDQLLAKQRLEIDEIRPNPRAEQEAELEARIQDLEAELKTYKEKPTPTTGGSDLDSQLQNELRLKQQVEEEMSSQIQAMLDMGEELVKIEEKHQSGLAELAEIEMEKQNLAELLESMINET